MKTAPFKRVWGHEGPQSLISLKGEDEGIYKDAAADIGEFDICPQILQMVKGFQKSRRRDTAS